MKKVLLVLFVALLRLNTNAQSKSPLEDGAYSLDAVKSLGIDTSGLSGMLIVLDGGLVIKSEAIALGKYSVFFIGEFKNAQYKLSDSGSSSVLGLGYSGMNSDFEDGEAIVTVGKNNAYIIVTTAEGSYSFLINKKY